MESHLLNGRDDYHKQKLVMTWIRAKRKQLMHVARETIDVNLIYINT